MNSKIFFCLIFFALTNCAIHGSFVTEHKEAWFNDPSDGLFYCRANVKDGGLADPICFEAALQKYDDVDDDKEDDDEKSSTNKKKMKN